MRQIQGKLVLLRVSGEFELPRVRVIGVQLYLHLLSTGRDKLDCEGEGAVPV